MWDNGVIRQGNDEFAVTEYSGITAKYSDDKCTVDFSICDSPESGPNNTQGIMESEMDSIHKAKFFTMYLDTQIVMYIPDGKQYIEAIMKLNEAGVMTVSEATDKLYSIGSTLNLSGELTSLVFNGVVTLDIANYEFKARPNEVIIPGYLRLKTDDGSIMADEQVSVAGVTMSKKTAEMYDYYQYSGVLIQVLRGTDISTLLTFK